MNTEITKFIPLDKSWIIRMGVLDVLNDRPESISFLKSQKELSEDLKALYQAALEWPLKNKIHVGESGTLFRFLQFASWKYKLDKTFVKEGTLLNRKICDNPNIVNFSLKELLKLDNNTSQWASAAVLTGNTERLEDLPYK